MPKSRVMLLWSLDKYQPHPDRGSGAGRAGSRFWDSRPGPILEWKGIFMMATAAFSQGVGGLLKASTVFLSWSVCLPGGSSYGVGRFLRCLDWVFSLLSSAGKGLISTFPLQIGAFSLPPGPSGRGWDILVLDVSGSMSYVDYPPSRIEAGKLAMSAFLERRHVSRPENALSVVAFNHEAWWAGSLDRVSDSGAKSHFQGILGSLRPEGGTDLSKAFLVIKSGVQEMLHKNQEAGTGSVPVRVLVLTDGHSDGTPVQCAALLKQQGVVIEIVGIGGSPREVNEGLLKQCASIENGLLLYRFIGDKGGGTDELVNHFTGIALR